MEKSPSAEVVEQPGHHHPERSAFPSAPGKHLTDPFPGAQPFRLSPVHRMS